MGKWIHFDFDIRKKRKAILVIFVPLSIPLVLILFLLIRKEIREHFFYGQVHKAIVKKIEGHNNSMPGGGGAPPSYTVTLLDLDDNRELDDNFVINDGLDKSLREFRRLWPVDDTVEIKVLNKHQAKILRYKGLEVQPYNSFFNLFWYYLIILFLISLTIFPYYVYFKYKKKEEKES